MRTEGSWKKYRTQRHGLLSACGPRSASWGWDGCSGAASYLSTTWSRLPTGSFTSRMPSSASWLMLSNSSATKTTITAALALLLLASTEYGAQIFPPLWGILAILPPAAGTFAVVLLRRRRQGRVHRGGSKHR